MVISQALIDFEISHENYTFFISEEKKYRRLKDNIRMMKNQRSDAEKIKLIEECKRIGIN